jgi:hypothetical protein
MAFKCTLIKKDGDGWEFYADHIEKTKFDGFPCIKITNPLFDLHYLHSEIFPLYGTSELMRFTFKEELSSINEQEYKTFTYIENIRRRLKSKLMIKLNPGHIPIYRYDSNGFVYLFL